jgi:hypothetical protein
MQGIGLIGAIMSMLERPTRYRSPTPRERVTKPPSKARLKAMAGRKASKRNKKNG